jgi:hypothetical protein
MEERPDNMSSHLSCQLVRALLVRALLAKSVSVPVPSKAVDVGCDQGNHLVRVFIAFSSAFGKRGSRQTEAHARMAETAFPWTLHKYSTIVAGAAPRQF